MALVSKVSIFCWPPSIPNFKKKVEKNQMTLSIFMGTNVISPLFGRPVFGWLPWAPGVSKKFVLSRNVLVISWPFIGHSQKVKSKKIFPTSLTKFKFLKKITLKTLYKERSKRVCLKHFFLLENDRCMQRSSYRAYTVINIFIEALIKQDNSFFKF